MRRGDEIRDAATALGGTYELGGKHAVIRFPNGAKVSAPLTPSDHRSVKNVILAMERASGRKLPRQRAGHYRHQRAEGQFITSPPSVMSPNSKRIRAMRDRLDEVDATMTAIADADDFSRADEFIELNKERNRLADTLHRYGFDVSDEWMWKG